MTRPRVSPALVAEITAGAPKRIVRKVDGKPDLAEQWDWKSDGDQTTVQAAEDVAVTLRARDGVLRSAEDVSCSCLLAPRCLHLLAVLGRLDLDEGDSEQQDAAASRAAEETPEYRPEPVEQTALDAGQREAAKLLWETTAKLLDGGATSAGAVLQAEVLRASHACRAVGLHRAAGASLRVVRSVRELREERPQFTLQGLTAELLETLHVAAHLIAAGEADGEQGTVAPVWRGTSRRVFRPIGGMKLAGLLCEAVRAGSYRGVATYLCDGDGRLFSVVDVVPDDMQRAHGTYDQVTRLAESGLSHRQLCREGLFVQGATASDDGRLGAGSSVKAVRAGTVRWTDEGPAALWKVPLTEQVARAYALAELPMQVRPAGSDLIFVPAVVVGASGPSLIVVAEGDQPLCCQAQSDHAGLAVRHNLELLARAPGLKLWLAGRLRLEQPRMLSLLAIGPAPKEADDESDDADAPRLSLPDDWHGRCNIALDKLQGENIRGTLQRRPAPAPLPAREIPDALAALRRRLSRLALGGRVTLPPEAARSIEAEAQKLERRMLKAGAVLLRRVAEAALSRQRDLTGARERGVPTELARAFVAGGLFERAARLQQQRAAWLG